MKIGKVMPLLIIGTVVTAQIRILSLGIIGQELMMNGLFALIWPFSAVAFSALMLFMAVLARRYPQYAPTRCAPFMAIVSFAAAYVVGWESASSILFLASSGFNMARDILGAIAALALFLLGISFFAGKSFIDRIPLVLIFPAVWMGVKLSMVFIELSNMTDFGEKRGDLAGMALLLVFLISAGKFLTGSGGGTVKVLFAMGGPAALVAITVNVPRIFLAFDIQQSVLSGQIIPLMPDDINLLPQWSDLMLGVFAFALMAHIVILGKRRRRGDDDYYEIPPNDVLYKLPRGGFGLNNGDGGESGRRNRGRGRRRRDYDPRYSVVKDFNPEAVVDNIEAGLTPPTSAAVLENRRRMADQSREASSLTRSVDSSLRNMAEMDSNYSSPKPVTVNAMPDEWGEEESQNIRVGKSLSDRIEQERRAKELAEARGRLNTNPNTPSFGEDPFRVFREEFKPASPDAKEAPAPVNNSTYEQSYGEDDGYTDE